MQRSVAFRKNFNKMLIRSIPLVWCILPFCAIIHKSGANDDEFRTVETKSGKVRGKLRLSVLNEIPFYSFKGIRYGKAPIGDLRFKAPEPVEPWSETLDAFEHMPTCVHVSSPPFSDVSPQSEDCLALNINVPASASPDNKVAVFVTIHGGAFYALSGNEDSNGPDYLVEHDIIVASLNYRLGLFGFLSLNTTEYSGNMGLKDQQLALKWIYENIEHFYGDPKKITIHGLSAGAVSTHYHVLSNESNKYFQRAILASGTAASIWATSDENDHSEFLYQIAAELDQPRTSITGLIKFLKNAPAKKLFGYATQRATFYNTLNFKMSPVIERKDAIRPFVVREPLDAYKDSEIDIDILFSVTETEMSSFYDTYPLLYPMFIKMNRNFTLKLPFRDIVYHPDSDEYHQMLQDVREFYFEDKRVGQKTSTEYIHMISDLNFDYPNYKAMKLHTQHAKGSAFAMRFSVTSNMNWLKRLIGDKNPYAEHAGDMCYVFKCYKFPYHEEVFLNRNSEESRISIQAIAHMTKIYSNFVKYGHPTHNNNHVMGYQPVGCFEIPTLVVTNDGLKVGQVNRKKEMEFWDKLERKAIGHIELEIKPINETITTTTTTKKGSKRNDDKW